MENLGLKKRVGNPDPRYALPNLPPQAGDLLTGSCPLRSDSVVGEGTNEDGIKPLTLRFCPPYIIL